MKQVKKLLNIVYLAVWVLGLTLYTTGPVNA